MRKFLSVIMVVAMLVTSILPTIANVAAADADALAIEMSTVGFVENEDGTASADIDLNVTNNPGITDLIVLVYYNNGEISSTEIEADGDYVIGSLGIKSTNNKVKKYFTATGVATSASISADLLEIGFYDPDTGDAFTYAETGSIATLTLTADAFSADMVSEIGIIVTEAYDVDGNEISIDPVTYTQSVAAKPEDPYATKYDVESFPADQFTINVTGTHVYENAFVEGEAPTVDVNVEFHGNTIENNPFGVWGYRCFITYPEELTAVAYKNGEIFKDSEMQAFEDCATNIDIAAEVDKINDEDPGNDWQYTYDILSGFEFVGYDTYMTDGVKVSVIQHLGTEWFDVTYGDGILETITFQLPEDAKAGDKWNIGICANDKGDICHNGGSTPEDQHPDIQPAPIVAAFDNGFIEVVSIKEESFEDFTFHTEDITISADNKTATVKMYVSGNSADVNPWGFWGARLFLYYPTDLVLTDVEQGKIVPEGGFTLGRLNLDLKALIADPNEQLNLMVTAAPLAFEEKGFDWENEDFRMTCFYFQAPTDALCIAKDGHYATITFEIPEGAKAGDSWNIGVAASYNNADVIGYLDDPALTTTVAKLLPHKLDDGSITLAGDSVVEPEHVHELEYTAAVEAGCHYEGNTEYWYCAGCDTVFADAAATQVTNRKNVIVPAQGSDLLVHMEAVDPACHYDGNIEYWICYECEQVWADEALTQLTNIKNVVLPAAGSENLHHVEYLAPTYEANGNIEYWYCDDCGQVWQDEALTQLTNRMNVIIPMLTKATVTVGTAAVVKGEDANVAITIDNNPGLFIGKFVITYDADVLTLVEATNGDLFADDNVIITTEDGKITLYFENNVVADVVENGVLANLIFATDAEGEPCDVALEIVADAENNINVAGEDVAVDVVAGKVTVINCAHEGTTLTPNQVKAPTVYEEGIMEYICECGEVAYTEAIAKLAGIEVDESINAIAGEQVVVDVELLNNTGVWALSATFAFDPYVFELVRVDSGLFAADEYSYSVADGVVTVYVESADLADVVGDGVAFALVFNAISCGYSDIDVELVAENTINAAGENVEFVAIDGSIVSKCALTHSEYVAPTATENGWQEYWYCEYCGSVYSDAEGRYITNRMNCYIPPVAIQLDSWIEVNEGEQAKVAVDLVSNPGVWAFSIKVSYDAENLTLAGIESGLFEIDDYSYSVADGVITIYVENAEIADIVENGTAFTLVFDTTVGGYYDIDAELVAENTINVAGENVEFGVIDGAITVIHVCDLEYFVAVEASCHQNGMSEYWYCADCDSVYADAEGTIVTNRKNLTIPYTAEIIHVDAVEATCHQNGNVEYWYCSECEAVFTDAALTQLSNFKSVVTPATAEIIYVESVEPTCCQTGNYEYWYCAECDAVFADAALTQLTNRRNLTIAATAEIIYVEAVEASCHQNGSAAYYYCSECDSVFDEDFVLTNRKNLTIPYTAEIIHVDAVEAVCHQTGNVEYWYCSECDAVFTDAALTQLSNFKSVIVPAPVELIYVAEADATCTADGNVEYWYCAECDAVFADAMGAVITNYKNVVVPALGHTAGDKVVTVEPTETTEGAWEIRCMVCGELLETGPIDMLQFITKASGTDYVKSVTLNDDVITVVARPNAPYVKIAVGYEKGIEIASDNLTIFYYTYSYLNINNGENAKIIATDANGNVKEYEVVVEWTDEAYTSYVGGYTTTDVQVSGETFNVYVDSYMNNASIGFVLTDGTTYEASEGLEVVLSGGKVYFKALESAENDTYTVTFTTRAGVEVVVTINFIFDYAEVEGAEGGYMVDGLEIKAGNVIDITVSADYAYASFRFVLKNTTSSIEWEEDVDVVILPGQAIHWFKIYNDGSNYVTKTFVVTNNANGVVDTYTVNVTFGELN